MERPRDAGLVRTVGVGALAASIVNTVVGAGIFAVPAALAACVGAFAPLAFVACAVGVGAVGICFAEGGRRVATSGGAYGTIEAAFGPLAGYVAGTLLWVGDVLACGGVAAALADVTVSVLPASARSVAHASVLVAVLGGIALVNVRGVQHGTRLINALTIVKLVPLAVFVLVGVFAMRAARFTSPETLSEGGLGRALILATFALTGMEAPLSASGEVTQPARTIPRAVAIGLLSVTALYVALQVVAQGLLGPALATSKVPLADAIGSIHPALRALMLGGAAVSMLGWIGSDLLGSPRIVFALARDGLMPRSLARVHAGTHTPHVAILAYTGVALALALSGTFAELAVLSTLTAAVLYMGGCAAAVRLAARERTAGGDRPAGVGRLTAAAVVGIGSMAILIALASRAEVLGLIGLVAASVALFASRRRDGAPAETS